MFVQLRMDRVSSKAGRKCGLKNKKPPGDFVISPDGGWCVSPDGRRPSLQQILAALRMRILFEAVPWRCYQILSPARRAQRSRPTKCPVATSNRYYATPVAQGKFSPPTRTHDGALRAEHHVLAIEHLHRQAQGDGGIETRGAEDQGDVVPVPHSRKHLLAYK